MKILEILLAFLSTQGKAFFAANTEAVGERIANNARRVAMLISANVIAVVLFCAGFKMAYGDVVATLKDGYGWTWTPGLIGGLILTSLASIGLWWSFSEDRWRRAVSSEGEESAREKEGSSGSRSGGGSPIENAIAVILLEIAQEMRSRRKSKSDAADEAEESDDSEEA